MDRVGIAAVRPLALVLAGGLVAAWLAACASSGNVGQRPLNVILIVVDTLRADHLGVYGYHRETSPRLDRFARENVLFTQARSQAACTFPSVNSLLTSRYPVAFQQSDDPYFGIPEDILSLPEMLQRKGYATAAVSASPIVRHKPSRFNPDGGFERGFDHFDEGCIWKSAQCVNWAAARMLARLGHQLSPDNAPRQTAPAPPPFLLYLHYMDPHGPYRPPAEFERRFSAHSPDPTDGNPNVLAERLYRKGESIDRAEILPLIDRYDDEILYFDHSFGKLLGLLDGLHLSDSTIVVVASDHGEEFLEHGHLKHCRVVFDSSIRTPLIVRVPGVGRRAPLGVAAANLDIVPTLLDYLDVEAPARLDGTSLRPAIETGASPRTFVHSQQGAWRSVATPDAKLVAHLARGTVTVFDLVKDPAEQHGSTERGDLPPTLVAELRRYLEIETRLAGRSGAVAAAKRATARLRHLGYLQ